MKTDAPLVSVDDYYDDLRVSRTRKNTTKKPQRLVDRMIGCGGRTEDSSACVIA